MYVKITSEHYNGAGVEYQKEIYANTAECTAERANKTLAEGCASGSVLYDTQDETHPMYILNVKADGGKEWI